MSAPTLAPGTSVLRHGEKLVVRSGDQAWTISGDDMVHLVESLLAGSDDGVGGTGSVFLLLDDPEVYGLPPDPRVCTADLMTMYKRAGTAAAGMIAAAAVSFLSARKKGRR